MANTGFNGRGRGRGWLNINPKPQAVPCPIPTTTQSETLVPTTVVYENQIPTASSSPKAPSVSSQDLCDTEEDEAYESETTLPRYQEIINRINAVDSEDDGLLFNQKIKYILEGWSQVCGEPDCVKESFEAVFEHCLKNTELSAKYIHLMSARSLLKQSILGHNIRCLFLTELQKTIEDGPKLKISLPLKFRNSVLILGEFYNKARLGTGEHYDFLAIPLLNCFEVLLELPLKPKNVQLFTNMLSINCAILRNKNSEKLNELMALVRQRILEDSVPIKCKMWLLLALEMANYKLGTNVSEICKYYKRQLNKSAVENLERLVSQDLVFSNSGISTSSSVAGDTKVETPHATLADVIKINSDFQVMELKRPNPAPNSSSPTPPADVEQQQPVLPPQSSLPPFGNTANRRLAQKLGRLPPSMMEQSQQQPQQPQIRHGNSGSSGSGGVSAGSTGVAGRRPILGSGARMQSWGNGNQLPDNNDNVGNPRHRNDTRDRNEAARFHIPRSAWQHDDRFDIDY